MTIRNRLCALAVLATLAAPAQAEIGLPSTGFADGFPEVSQARMWCHAVFMREEDRLQDEGDIYGAEDMRGSSLWQEARRIREELGLEVLQVSRLTDFYWQEAQAVLVADPDRFAQIVEACWTVSREFSAQLRREKADARHDAVRAG
mgnify:CR=1 FL=1